VGEIGRPLRDRHHSVEVENITVEDEPDRRANLRAHALEPRGEVAIDEAVALEEAPPGAPRRTGSCCDPSGGSEKS
jgi:hypothetical protein